jgi:DNA-binding MarR family transcriptional regulator
MGYLGAATEFDDGVAKKLKLSRTDMRCLELVASQGPLTAGRLAEESGLTTGAVTFILDRLEEAGMVARRRDTEDRRRVWVEIVPAAQERLAGLQQPVADEMRQVAQHFKADELAVVRDFMRQAKEVFQRHVTGAVTGDSVAWNGEQDTARTSEHTAGHSAARTAARTTTDGSGGAPEGK